MGRPSGPIRAARQKKVGGHPPKSGGPNEGRPGAGPAARRAARSFGAGCHHSRRAAHRAATLKVRAALTEKGPPLGPPFEKGAARRAALRAARPARAGPKGGQGRARGRPTGPPSRPDHSVKCAGSSKTGSGDLFLPIFFGVCVKDTLFRPPRGPPPPPQAHQRPRPVKATTYRTSVPMNTMGTAGPSVVAHPRPSGCHRSHLLRGVRFAATRFSLRSPSHHPRDRPACRPASPCACAVSARFGA